MVVLHSLASMQCKTKQNGGQTNEAKQWYVLLGYEDREVNFVPFDSAFSTDPISSSETLPK